MSATPTAVTVDLVVFTVREGRLNVLLVRRREAPFAGRWSLPGGPVGPRLTLEEAARRHLLEKTGLRDVYLEQLYTFGDPGRDPRARTVTVAYYALIRPRPLAPSGDAAWFPALRPPALAFDHAEILRTGIRRLRAKLGYTTVAFELLPSTFTLSELQTLYETILGRRLDKRNFRRKILSLDLLRPRPERRAAGPHRPARLYSFKRGKMTVLESQIV
ncbi:MAG TPA: NUDIX domain-containing protein [Planctomycetota bacterium]|nr:NUDIX domain-containing protein [Planctomycetota bacterium]